VWDNERVVIIPDHYIFTSDPRANRNVDILREVCGGGAAAAQQQRCPQGLGSAVHRGGISCSREHVAATLYGLLPGTNTLHCIASPAAWAQVADKYKIKYFYDIKDRGDFRANPDYKGVCHVALAQEGHCKPGEALGGWVTCSGAGGEVPGRPSLPCRLGGSQPPACLPCC
jgi:homoaconitase/3-isopropylmalate dehydratase large subunit